MQTLNSKILWKKNTLLIQTYRYIVKKKLDGYTSIDNCTITAIAKVRPTHYSQSPHLQTNT